MKNVENKKLGETQQRCEPQGSPKAAARRRGSTPSSATGAVRGRLHPALPVEGATRAPVIDKILHDIRNPISFIANNLSALSKYVKNLQRLLAHNQELVDLINRENSILPPQIEKSLYQLKAIHAECNFNSMLKDIEELAIESLEGCQQIAGKIQDLQDLFHDDSDR